jgi:hypothetical protein
VSGRKPTEAFVGRISVKRFYGTLICGIVVASSVLVVVPRSYPATPTSGVVGPSHPTERWGGPHAVISNRQLGPCGSQTTTCDEYKFQVDVPKSHWDDHVGGVKLEISWPSSDDKFELRVRDESQNLVARTDASLGTTDPGITVGFVTETSNVVVVPNTSGVYTVQVIYFSVTDSAYSGTISFLSQPGTKKGEGGAIFDTTTQLEFGPATLVSAHFLGAEPNITIERHLPGSNISTVDGQRVFVDFPLSSRAQIGQLHRSTDGGDSFRVLFDPDCPERSRPSCATGGGGDSDNEVNPLTGTLFYTDQEAVVTHESVASSTDHGDSFPEARQWAVTNSTTVTDRQWLTAIDPEVVSVGPLDARRVEALLAYFTFPAGGLFIQGIDQQGLPVPQEVPQIPPAIGHLGPLRADLSNGPGRGWIYVPYTDPSGIRVATAFGPRYQLPEAWKAQSVDPTGHTDNFVWLDLDEPGNAYVVWEEDGKILLSASRIDDPANDPETGRPGSTWSAPIRVSLPSIGSAVFPAITAGSAGRVAIVYNGTDQHVGKSQDAGPDTSWHTYAAVITNALGDGGLPIVTTGRVSHRPITRGAIDFSLERGDLLDFIDIDHDEQGRVGVVYTDNLSTFASPNDDDLATGKPFTHFAKQTSGPSLVSVDQPVSVPVSLNTRQDLVDDATWPNSAAGLSLPALDLTKAMLSIEDGDLVARMTLGEGTFPAMARDLTRYGGMAGISPPTRRLAYILRFATADEVYHLGMEVNSNGSSSAFGGRLDENDRRSHGGTVVVASYRSDPGYRVTGSLADNVLTLRAPAEAFGLSEGDELFSATGFAMAGPRTELESLFDPMRTIDATPPFDVVLTHGPQPGLDCTPETSSVGIGSDLELTCFALDEALDALPGARVKVEVIGANESDALSCTTDSTGRCEVVHSAISKEGTSTYRARIDDALLDSDEGRDEGVQPGSIAEPDGTDVVEATAARIPSVVRLTPKEIIRGLGSRASLDATVMDATGTPLSGVELAWASEGPGDIVDEQAITDSDGRAHLFVDSQSHGNQVISVMTPQCTSDGDCEDSAVVHWGPDYCDVFGTDGPDTIQGTDRGETICGFAGADVFQGLDGLDRLFGGSGEDILWGGAGGDRLFGASGDDRLQGQSGDDRLRGGRGSDFLTGGSGSDTCTYRKKDDSIKSCEQRR